MNPSDLYEMLEAAGDAAFVVDACGSILFWNARATHALGFPAADVIGKHCAALLEGCDGDPQGVRLCTRECAVMEMTRRGAPVAAFDAQVKTHSGARKWVNISIVPAQVQGQRVLVHLLRDIEDRKNVELLTRDIAALVGRLTGHPPEALFQHTRSHAANEELTTRERKVLQALARGASTAAIARELNVSPATVRNHVQHILRKLRVHTRLEAVVRAAARDLL